MKWFGVVAPHRTIEWKYFNLRNDEQLRKVFQVFHKQFQQRSIRTQSHFRFERGIDRLLIPSTFQVLQNFTAEPVELFILRGHTWSEAASEITRFGKERHVDAFWFARRLRQILPDFLGGEDENRRGQTDQGAADFPHCGLRGAPRYIFGRFGVKAVLQQVEIKGAEVDDAVVG